MNERYFDNAATSPLDPRVLEAMLPYFAEQPGNTHSIHAWGIRARSAVEKAREQVADLVGAEDPSQIVFTSGATESNNWILRSFGAGWASPFEHSSVRDGARALGFGVIANDGYALTPPTEDRALVSVMTVNNEIGTIFDLAPFAGRRWKRHTDATQAVGKIPFDVGDLDFVSFSAHKFHGPKGVGVLYAKDPPALQPMLVGGGQESGLRSGTLNVPGIVGAGAAAAIAAQEREQNFAHANALRAVVLDELADCAWVQTNGGPKASPFILSLSFRDLQGETLVLELDALGFAVSGGAACSSRKVEPSHVLTALNLASEWERGTVRISFGRQNTAATASDLGKALRQTAERLLKMRK